MDIWWDQIGDKSWDMNPFPPFFPIFLNTPRHHGVVENFHIYTVIGNIYGVLNIRGMRLLLLLLAAGNQTWQAGKYPKRRLTAGRIIELNDNDDDNDSDNDNCEEYTVYY